MAPNLGFIYSHLQNEDKESTADVEVCKQLFWFDVIEKKNMGAARQLGLNGGAQPIFIKQLKFNPTVWKTCLRSLMEAQSRNMLKLLHQRMEFPHFFVLF
jgi:hypothetical protein